MSFLSGRKAEFNTIAEKNTFVFFLNRKKRLFCLRNRKKADLDVFILAPISGCIVQNYLNCGFLLFGFCSLLLLLLFSFLLLLSVEMVTMWGNFPAYYRLTRFVLHAKEMKIKIMFLSIRMCWSFVCVRGYVFVYLFIFSHCRETACDKMT